MTDKRNDKSTWVIGGGVLIGMGVGLFFIQKSSIAFVASMFLGLGLGLIIAAILSRERSGK
jgi:Na+/melibiose symporter-like transporter